MPKTKESIAKYNKEYFARPEVIARAKVRNAQRRDKRKEYKKTEKGKEAEKRYRESKCFKESSRSRRLFWRYGITVKDYDSMLKSQGGVCAICKRESRKRLYVDHCHTTGKVRGILCVSCNFAIGLMDDDISIIEKSIQYLQKWTTKKQLL